MKAVAVAYGRDGHSNTKVSAGCWTRVDGGDHLTVEGR